MCLKRMPCVAADITRPPRLFWWAWQLLRPFLDEHTRRRVAVLPARAGGAPSMSEFGDEPLTIMDAESLPAFLGGAAEVPTSSTSRSGLRS